MIGNLGVKKTLSSLYMIEAGGLYVGNPEYFHVSSTRCGGGGTLRKPDCGIYMADLLFSEQTPYALGIYSLLDQPFCCSYDPTNLSKSRAPRSPWSFLLSPKVDDLSLYERCLLFLSSTDNLVINSQAPHAWPASR